CTSHQYTSSPTSRPSRDAERCSAAATSRTMALFCTASCTIAVMAAIVRTTPASPCGSFSAIAELFGKPLGWMTTLDAFMASLPFRRGRECVSPARGPPNPKQRKKGRSVDGTDAALRKLGVAHAAFVHALKAGDRLPVPREIFPVHIVDRLRPSIGARVERKP